LLLAGSSVSMLGSRVTTIAYPMLVLYLTGSPVTAGWVAFAATAPSVLVYMPAGALIDRWDPRRVMLLSEFGRGVAIATVAVTVALGRTTIPQLVVTAVIEEILEVFSTLAERRYVRSLVEPNQASSALVRIEARTHVVVLAGRPLGGFLFELEPIFPFPFDAVSLFP
jgi:MFS family permease